MKEAFTGDWHIDNIRKTYLVDGTPNREIDLDEQVNTMLKECIEREVEWFVILGDLYDKHVITAYYFNKVVDILRMFTHNKIRVVVIPGNHELKESGLPITSALSKLKDEYIYVYDRISLVSQAGIILIPHVRRNEYKNYGNYTEYVKKEISRFKISKPIVAGHFQPTSATPGSEQEMFAGSTRFVDCSIFKNALVICSHVHKPQEIGRIVIPGSPIRFILSERDEAKRFIVYDTENQELESIGLNCQKMALVKIDLFSKNTLSLPDDKIRKYKNMLVYIKVTTSRKNRYRISAKDVTSKFEKMGAYVMSYEVHTIKDDKKEQEESDIKNVSMTPISIFSRITNKVVKKVDERKRILSKGKKALGEVND